MRKVTKYLVFLPILLLGCYATGSVEKKQQLLQETASTYYNLFMWKSYEKASQFVDNEKKDKFDSFLLNSKDDLNITNYDIREVVFNSAENKGMVKVIISYYKYPSVSEKTMLLQDPWILRGKMWYIYSDFDEEIFK
ncbi:MAG TPA: hypothetical protein VFF49_04910 [Thermodesulfobacteriota bacterium]|nr:hypothetical protein [Thermodesulfobacteriota bacterium]